MIDLFWNLLGVALALAAVAVSVCIALHALAITLDCKVLLGTNVYGWRMTGLLGRGGAWFVGFSRAPKRETA